MSVLQHFFLPYTVTKRHPSSIKRRGPEISGSRSAVIPNSGKAAVVPPPIAKDWNLVQQALAGDLHAREELFAAHTAKLYRTAFSIVRNKEDAEDAVQDSLCRAFLKLGSYQGRSSFSTWLTRIVINSALMRRRKRACHPENSLDESLDGRSEPWNYRLADASPSPEAICAANEIHELVAAQVRQLPPALRAAIQLYGLDGLSSADCMKTLGIRKGGFKARVHRARLKLVCRLRPALRTRRAHQQGERTHFLPAAIDHLFMAKEKPSTPS